MAKKNKISSKKKIEIKISETSKNKNNSKYISTAKLTPSQYISNIRATVSPDNYADAISDIEKMPYSITQLLSSKRKKSLKELQANELTFINFDSEFYWAKNILTRNINLINEFVRLLENPRKLTPFRQIKVTPFGHFKLTP
jgi:hypothetical protein